MLLRRFYRIVWLSLLGGLITSCHNTEYSQCRLPTAETQNTEVDFISAERSEGEGWSEALSRQSKTLKFKIEDQSSMIGSAKLYLSQTDYHPIPYWPGTYEELLKVFRHIRDERRYFDRSHPELIRRALWLYPRDGCFARAAHTAMSIERLGTERPGKVFAFGHLSMKTPYVSRGWIFWSYHVAAAYRHLS